MKIERTRALQGGWRSGRGEIKMLEMRTLKEAELPEAMKLVWEVFLEFEAPEYSRQGIEEFRSFLSPQQIGKAVGHGEIALCAAFWEKDMAGVMAVRNKKHLCLLFVKREFQRRGIGRELLSWAKGESGGCLTVHASPYGIPFYLATGFTADGPEREENGIRYTPMTWKG